jgi:hypothetical protein
MRRRLRTIRHAYRRLTEVDRWTVYACYKGRDTPKTYRLSLERQPLLNYLHWQLYDFAVSWVLFPGSINADIKSFGLGCKNVVVFQEIDLGEDARLWDSYWRGCSDTGSTS